MDTPTLITPEEGVHVTFEVEQSWPPVIPVQPATCQVQFPAGSAVRTLKFFTVVEFVVSPSQKASCVKLVPSELLVKVTRRMRSLYGFPLPPLQKFTLLAIVCSQHCHCGIELPPVH